MSNRAIKTVDYTTLIKIFELDGFELKKRKGDHIIMVKPGIKRPVVIKASPKKVPIAHIRTNMTTADMSRERYFELLDMVK